MQPCGGGSICPGRSIENWRRRAFLPDRRSRGTRRNRPWWEFLRSLRDSSERAEAAAKRYRTGRGIGGAMTRFLTDVQMRFRDLDGMGHVNNAVYLSYTELARMQFYLQVANKKTLDEIDFILAHVDIDFESQAVWGDQIQVAVWPAKIGTSSFTLRYEISEKRTRRVLARANSVLVSYDYEKKKSKPIPPEFRKVLEAALEGYGQ